MRFRAPSTVPIALLGVLLHCYAAPAGRTDLLGFAARYGFPKATASGTLLEFQSPYTAMVFETGSRRLRFNNVLIWLNAEASGKSGNWSISSDDAAVTLAPLLRAPRVTPMSAVVVVLDPGHGGRDTGAIGRRRVLEKKVVLDVAKRTRRILDGHGVTVHLTRTRDTTLGLMSRTKLAQQWGAHVFVSIHINSAANRAATGIETHVCAIPGHPSTAGNAGNLAPVAGNRHNGPNVLLGYCLQRELLRAAKTDDRGIRRSRFEVLRSAPCPAALVECGFVSNPADENKMLTRAHRDALAEGIARGIRIYVGWTRK